MLKTLKQQQGIILAAVAALAVVVAAGYFSAVKRSEPKYRNKVEEMMFEEGNKSPKYVITLPDKKSPQELKEERQRREASAPGKQSADDDMTPQQRVLSNMPLLIKLKSVEDAEPLKNIESEAALVEKEGDFQLPKPTVCVNPGANTAARCAFNRISSGLPSFSKISALTKPAPKPLCTVCRRKFPFLFRLMRRTPAIR